MLKFIVLFLLAPLIFTSDALPQRGKGKYVADNSGKYNPDHDKWAYKHDNRGKYVHVHIPYNGGYGPFQNPYEHDGRPYEHDEKKYKDVFDVNVFTDKPPVLRLEYGAPSFNAAKRS